MKSQGSIVSAERLGSPSVAFFFLLISSFSFSFSFLRRRDCLPLPATTSNEFVTEFFFHPVFELRLSLFVFCFHFRRHLLSDSGFIESYRILLGFTGFYWVLLSLTRFY